MREKKLLQELHRQQNYIQITYLCEVLNVSKRTIMNDLKLLEQDGLQHGFCIHVKRGSGYFLEIIDNEKFQAYCGREETFAFNARQRVDMILNILLLTHDFITQEYLANVLQVSKSIIKADLQKVEEELLQHHILIERKAHYGIRIITQSLHRKEYLQKRYEEQDPYIVKVIEDVAGEQFRDVEKLLIEELKERSLSTNYNELKKIDAFLKITIYAHQHKLYEEKPFMESKSIYFEMAKRLSQKVETIYHLRLWESEIHDLGVYIKTKTKNEERNDLYSEDLKSLISTFLSKADQDYQTNFNQDEQFKNSLLAHVSLLVDRLHQSISFSNPLKDEISVKYPVFFNMAIQFTTQLEQLYHVQVTQDEIGFIATHFAAHMEKEIRDKLSTFNRIAILCSSGGGSAFLIKLKIESLFSGASIQTFSLLEQSEVKRFQPDVIFTITDLEETYDVPIIKIKELLDDQDILRIKNMFGLAQSDMVMDVANRLFAKEIFHIIEKSMEYETLLQQMGTQLEQLGYAEVGYKDYVIQREQFLTTIYTNGVAIPHPMNMCAIKDCISVAILKQGAKKENKNARIVFLINLQKTSMELHQQITRVLFDVMSNEYMVAALQHVSSYEEFMIQMRNQNW